MARLIAIDLGAHAVKVTVLQGSGQDHELEDEFVQRVPQDGTHLPALSDRLASLDLLLRDNPELSGAHLVEVAWSSDRAAVRRMTLPFTEKAQIEQTLPFAVESEVPFELDEMQLGWRSSGSSGDVLTTLARTAEVRTLVDALVERDLDPRRVVVDGDALGAYARFHDAVTAVIDVGHGHTVVTVGRGGRAEMTRSISVAGRSFTKAIQDALGCTWGEAEAFKHGSNAISATPPDEEEVTGRIDEVEDDQTDPAYAGIPSAARERLDGAVGLLLAEIRSTLVQAEDSLQLEVDDVVLTGGGARLSELRSYLEQDLGLPVRDADDTLDGSLFPESALARAMALHMAGEPPGDVIDLRVGELEYRGGMDLTRSILTYGGAGVGFFLAAVVVMFGYRMYDYSQQLADVESRIASVVEASLGAAPADMSSGALVSLMAEMVGEAQEEAEFLGDGNAIPETVDLLHKLTTAFPPHPDVKVNIDTLEINPNAITIDGITEGFPDVDRIGSGLQEAGHFREVVATPGKRNTKGNLNFTVAIDRSEVDPDDTDASLDEEF